MDVKIYRWEDISPETVMGGLSRRAIHTERMTLGLFDLPKGSTVPSHSHEQEQVTYLLRGKALFKVDGREFTVTGGGVIHFPSGVSHSAEVLDDALSLDVFSPPREDWK